MIKRLLNISFEKLGLIVFFMATVAYDGNCMTIGFNQPTRTIICSKDTLRFRVLNPANKSPNGYTWTLNDFFNNPIVTFTNQPDSLVLNGFPNAFADNDDMIVSVSADSAGSPITTDYVYTLTRYPSPEVSLGPDKKMCPGKQVFLDNVLSQGIGYGYEWYLNPNNVLSTDTAYLTSSAGKYYVAVTDGSVNQPEGCVTKAFVNVISFGKPTVTAISTSGKPVRCFGKTLTLDARIDIESSPPYNYNWEYTAGMPASISGYSPISARTLSTTSPNNQTYNLTVSDANFCTSSSSITIKVNPALTTNSTISDITLCKYNTTVLSTSSSGGSVTGLGYTYSWLPTAGLSNPSIDNPTVNPLEFDGIVYTVAGTDASNCTATDLVTVRKARLSLSFKEYTTDTIAICGGSILGFNAGRKWGVPGFKFEWSSTSTNLERVNDSTYNSARINFSSKFYVMVTDTNKCTDKDSLIVNVIPAPAPNIGDHTKTVCIGSSLTLNVTPLSGGSYTYNWYNNSDISGTIVPIPDILNGNAPNPNFPAAYIKSSRQYKLVVMDNLTKCTSTDLVDISTSPPPDFQINTPAEKVYIQTPTVFTSNAAENLSLVWRVENRLNSTIAGVSAEYSFDSVKVYHVILNGVDPLGCATEDTLNLKVRKHSSQTFFIPNVFAPASVDGRNSAFKIFDDLDEILPDLFSVKIYNVMGQEIFTLEDKDPAKKEAYDKMKKEGWKGDGYTPGLYTYYIKGYYADETPFVKTGGVTLLK